MNIDISVTVDINLTVKERDLLKKCECDCISGCSYNCIIEDLDVLSERIIVIEDALKLAPKYLHKGCDILQEIINELEPVCDMIGIQEINFFYKKKQT